MAPPLARATTTCTRRAPTARAANQGLRLTSAPRRELRHSPYVKRKPTLRVIRADNLMTMSYSQSGSLVMNESSSGDDSGSGTNTQTTYSVSDTYNGTTTGQTYYSLSEVGKYSNFSWAVTRFTEAETTYVNSVYTGSGQYTDTNGNGTWSFTDTANLNFNLYGVGSYANGSFSFQTFNSSTSASISTDYQELGHGGGWVSYSTEVQTAHSMNLTELGQNQTGNYTLTLTDSMSQTFTGIPASGHTVSFTGSNSVTNTSTGAFSLVGGNPYFPPQSGWVIGSAGAGVGIAIPWYGNNPSGPMQSSGNRVTISLPGIHPSRLWPDWSVLPPGGYGPGAGGTGGSAASAGSNRPGTPNSGAGIDPTAANASTIPGPNVGVPPAGGDAPNLGLPVGKDGPASPARG